MELYWSIRFHETGNQFVACFNGKTKDSNNTEVKQDKTITSLVCLASVTISFYAIQKKQVLTPVPTSDKFLNKSGPHLLTRHSVFLYPLHISVELWWH